MQKVEVNITALAQAAQLVVGVQAARAINEVYEALDAAERRGYQHGCIDGIQSSDDAYEQGFLEGSKATLGSNAAALAKETEQPDDKALFDIWNKRMHRDDAA